MKLAVRSTRIALLLLLAVAPLHAQLSLSTVVDLALKNSPKVRMAQADLDKATATLRQTKDAYIPNLAAGSGLGYTYGFPVGSPTLYSFTSQGLIFDISQFSYIRASKEGIDASLSSLIDMRQQIEVDASLSYIQLDDDLRQQAVMNDEYSSAQKLGEIVQQRLDAGLDSQMDLTRARLSVAQVHLKQLHLESEIDGVREHLALLTGLPADSITTDTASIPTAEPDASAFSAAYMPPAIEAAYANARSKREQAKGDRRQLYWPQIGFVANYARFASFNNYQDYYGSQAGVGGDKPFQFNNAAIGMQMTWPLFDRVRKAKADLSEAEADRAEYEADSARDLALEGQQKLRHIIEELSAQQDVATLDRDLAQEQLDAVTVQITSGSGNPNAPPITPIDEQNARISAGQKSLDLMDADYQLRRAQLNLLRATGGLEAWIRSASSASKP
ncbi:MAG TPA: TolC family protein [Acidobacteriaceae bacterium]|nr:TolC family protein [Acidobacteriaceae bacterium]